MKKLKKYKISIIWAAIMMIACTINLQSNEPPKIEIPYLDKIVHFGIYAILGFLLTIEPKITNLKALIICACYGLLIEIIQIFLPWRSFEVADIIADTLGAAVGIWFAQNLS